MQKLLPIISLSLVFTTGCDPKSTPRPSEKPSIKDSSARIATSGPANIVHTALFDGGESISHTGMKQFLGDEPIEIDFDSTYHFSATASASGPARDRERQYLGFASFDADGLGIGTYHVAKYPGSQDTTLAADLNPGDKQIVLSDATGWNNLGTEHRCAIAWYPYTNKQGHTYPPYTYTRHFVADLWDAGAIEGNTITLLKEWTGLALTAGTAVRNAESGGSYNYALNSSLALPETPTNFSATVTGVWDDGRYSDTIFRPGTAFIRPLVLANWSGTGSTVTVQNFKIEVTP